MELQRIFPWRKKPQPAHAAQHPAASLQQAMNELLEGFFNNDDPWPLSRGEFGLSRGFRPSLDVSEDAESYHVSAELPGMGQEDIEVTLTHGMLTIKGEKRATRKEKKKDFYIAERSYGKFQRAIQLPADADEDNISATFKGGVLEIIVPKAPAAKPEARKIDVTPGR